MLESKQATSSHTREEEHASSITRRVCIAK